MKARERRGGFPSTWRCGLPDPDVARPLDLGQELASVWLIGDLHGEFLPRFQTQLNPRRKTSQPAVIIGRSALVVAAFVAAVIGFEVPRTVLELVEPNHTFAFRALVFVFELQLTGERYLFYL